MPDPIFAHPRLAPVYDAFEDDRADLAAYVAIADELGAYRVLDVGCGTGNLALLLAARGRQVTGVDPAEASLRVARAKDVGGTVTWVSGDVLPRIDADLAVLTGNVAQVFLTDPDWARLLGQARAALRPGGYLVFETRRPAWQAWQEWERHPAVVRDVPGVGQVCRKLAVTEVRLPLVSFRFTYTFAVDGAVLTSESTLRFRERAEIETSLLAAGYRIAEVRQAPDRPDREWVFLAQRADG